MPQNADHQRPFYAYQGRCGPNGDPKLERMYRIAAVCTGNICRSPMAEFALRHAFAQAGLQEHVVIDSAGISDEEFGNPIDPRARNILEREGIDPTSHTAQSITSEWLTTHDLLLAMDTTHAHALRTMATHTQTAQKVHMLRAFDPAARDLDPSEQSIADPWYGNAAGFEDTWAMITAAVPGVVEYVRIQLAPTAEPTEG